MIDGDEGAPDEHAEDEQAAHLDLALVAELAKQRAHVLHPAVVDGAQARGDTRVAPRPVAYGEIDAALQLFRDKRDGVFKVAIKP